MVPKSITNFEGGLFSSSVWKSMAAIRRPFQTPIPWPCRSWAGNSFRIIARAILRCHESLNQLSRQQVLQYSFDSSIGPYRQQLIITQCPCPNWANSYSTVGIQSHSSILKMARTVLTQFRKYSQMIHLPGSASQFFTYTGHLSSPGDFFPR
ncbi:hypothetical protein O181_049766 [Austropuccinia psidii MF-1]|uniref:Uncharacterized protein n=1 Tax=Austropuccinia psidii MF-1 TaxID=1389203 RepID=A0A9Q3E0J3_9BASI|nr:hypothetical protein [Austropuccinia psidii MF-1]